MITYRRRRYLDRVAAPRRVRRRLDFSSRPRFRRRSRRNGRTTTNRASSATTVGFRARKTSTRTFRRMLWRDTLNQTHHRSLLDQTVVVATPNNLTQATLSILEGLPGNFWTAAGGTVAHDTGTAVPLFSGDLVLRGGISRITLTNRVNPTDTMPSDPVRVSIFAVWTKKVPGVITFPSPVPTMWDPSTVADFLTYGRVLFKREALLKGDGEVLSCYFRYKVQKIDRAVFNSGGGRLQWFVLVSQTSNTEAIAVPENVDVVLSHNVSFAADAIGTT